LSLTKRKKARFWASAGKFAIVLRKILQRHRWFRRSGIARYGALEKMGTRADPGWAIWELGWRKALGAKIVIHNRKRGRRNRQLPVKRAKKISAPVAPLEKPPGGRGRTGKVTDSSQTEQSRGPTCATQPRERAQ